MNQNHSRNLHNRKLKFPKRAHGFTLIELMVVVVILGVLAVSATSAYLNYRKEAKIASLMGAKDAFATANTLVFAKALLQGEEDEVATIRNIDLDNDGHNDVIGFYGLIRYVVSAEELAGFDVLKFSISMPYRPGDPADKPYFLLGFTTGDEDGDGNGSGPNALDKCHYEVFYPRESSGNVEYKLISDKC